MTGAAITVDVTQPEPITLGKPLRSHGAAIHRLIEACAPLDLNSRYAYLLLCEHYADTCVIAQAGDDLVGFISAYRPPAREDALFVWQVAVGASARGTGLATTMLHALLARSAVQGCAYLETTISPSNVPSRRLFGALARERCAPMTETLLFAETDFGGEDHECEMLIRIGPFEGRITEETSA